MVQGPSFGFQAWALGLSFYGDLEGFRFLFWFKLKDYKGSAYIEPKFSSGPH